MWGPYGDCGSVAFYTNIALEFFEQNSYYGKTTNEEVDFFKQYRGKVLEVACGNGRLSCQLIKYCDLYGIEYSLPFYKQLQQKLNNNPKFICWDALETPYPIEDNYFDNIIIPFSTFPLLHSFKDVQANVLFKELFRILKPNGNIIVNDFVIDYPAMQYKTFNRTYNTSKGEITEEVNVSYETFQGKLFTELKRKRMTLFKQGNSIIEAHVEFNPVLTEKEYEILAKNAFLIYESLLECEFYSQISKNHIFKK